MYFKYLYVGCIQYFIGDATIILYTVNVFVLIKKNNEWFVS